MRCRQRQRAQSKLQRTGSSAESSSAQLAVVVGLLRIWDLWRYTGRELVEDQARCAGMSM